MNVTEIYLLFRDGHEVHSHRNRAVFERWMEHSPDRYPPERCEIVRFVPETDLAALREADLATIASLALVNKELADAGHSLGLLSLQSDRYRDDPEFRDAVDEMLTALRVAGRLS